MTVIVLTGLVGVLSVCAMWWRAQSAWLRAQLYEVRDRSAEAILAAEARVRVARGFVRCGDVGPHDQSCDLPAGHPGAHWRHAHGLLQSEWTEAAL